MPLALLVRKVQQVQLVQLAHKVLPARKEQLVLKEFKALLEQQDRKVVKEAKDQSVILAQQAQQDRPAH